METPGPPGERKREQEVEEGVGEISMNVQACCDTYSYFF